MTYRPYPSPDRARHQVQRHARPAPAPAMSPTSARLFRDFTEGLNRVRIPVPDLMPFAARSRRADEGGG